MVEDLLKNMAEINEEERGEMIMSNQRQQRAIDEHNYRFQEHNEISRQLEGQLGWLA